MDIALREAIVATIRADPASASVITSIALDPDGTGTITYNLAGVWIDPRAPGFRGGTRAITDEEVVRAYLLWRLAGRYRYASRPDILEVEHVYDPVGRPGKGGRIDVLVRRPVVPPTTPPGRAAVVGPPARGDSFLFIECKSPSEYDADFRLIDGQLFRLRACGRNP